MSARDELEALIQLGMDNSWDDGTENEFAPREVASVLLDRGWRPPARVVTTVEELDALPEQAVIRDSEGTVAELAFGMWFSTEGRVFGLRLPATVLYEPKEGE